MAEELVCWDRAEIEGRGYTFVTELLCEEAPGHGTIFNIARRRQLSMEKIVCYRVAPNRWCVFTRPS